MCLVQRFLAATLLSLAFALDHYFTPIPPPSFFSTDKSEWRVPGSVGVGDHWLEDTGLPAMGVYLCLGAVFAKSGSPVDIPSTHLH